MDCFASLAMTVDINSRCRFISGRAFNAAACFEKIFAIRSGAKFMSAKPVAVLATS